MWRRMVEFARTRNPSCRVPCCGDVAGKKSSRYISVAQIPQDAHPSKKIFERLANLTGNRPWKSPSLYPCNTDPFKISLLQKAIKIFGNFNGKLAAEKISPLYISSSAPLQISPIQKNFKSLVILTTRSAVEKSPDYIHVTRTCQNAHPFENFTFCKRLARGIHSPGNTLRSLTCTRLYEQRRAGQRNSASGPQTSQNRHKWRFGQHIHHHQASERYSL